MQWSKHNGAARAEGARRKARSLVTDQLWGIPLHPVTVVVRWGQGIPVCNHPQFNPGQVAQAMVTRGLQEADKAE